MGYIIGAVIAFVIMWIISVRRKLAVLDENVNNAMGQIGIQLSSRFDALMAFLDLTKSYAGYEALDWMEGIKLKRSVITAKSVLIEVAEQEYIMNDALERIAMVAEQHPKLKEDKSYAKCMDAVNSYEKMLHTSRLIYNDSVAKLNRAVRMLPNNLIAGLLGFHQRDYLESVKNNP